MKPTEQNTNYLYVLIDPATKEYRYVGISGNPPLRLQAHIQQARSKADSNKHKRRWINNLSKQNLKPELVVVCRGTRAFVCEREIELIARLREKDYPLVNIADGGNDPPSWDGKTHTEETKQKASESIGAWYQENEHPSKGIPLSAEHIAKIKASRKRNGTKSDATVMLQKRGDNPDWYINLSKSANNKGKNNPMYGKRQSAESVQKNKLTNRMAAAAKKGDFGFVAELQEDYKAISGEYHSKYLDFCYVQW